MVYLIARKSGEPYGVASGLILSADSYIANNYLALKGADAVEIRFSPILRSSIETPYAVRDRTNRTVPQCCGYGIREFTNT